ncbi:TolC family protein [Bergeyella sp. RCAD1439]|uniref:TolC family protein n=1 Tax=Bergeyella anatis TaxID=3113737 RepID=UPI002E17DB79|nr:TolC family protein [Bergeyella sp. RCAD1439]
MKNALIFFFVFILTEINAQKKWPLQQCIDYAVKNNLQIVQNNFNKNIQEKNLDIAKREKLPTVSGTFNNNASFGQGQDVV